MRYVRNVSISIVVILLILDGFSLLQSVAMVLVYTISVDGLAEDIAAWRQGRLE